MPYNGIPLAVLDARYLRLDASNDPVTAGLEINAATADEPVLVLQTTDDDATNPILEIQNAAGAMLGEWQTRGGLNFAAAITQATPGLIAVAGVRRWHEYGTENLFIGKNSGNFTLTGGANIGLGDITLDALTSGEENLAVGTNCLTACTSGSYNVGLGTQALQSNTTGARNMAIGNTVLGSNIAGTDNMGIGQGTLGSNVTGVGNVAIGTFTLESSLGTVSVGIGYAVMTGQTTGAENTAVGPYASQFNVVGWNNTCIGYFAGRGVGGNSYSNNTLVGHTAGTALTTGSNNVLIGYQTGDVLTTGASNIIIGTGVDPSAAGASNEINIGGVYKGDVSTPSFSLPVAGTIGGAVNYAGFATDGDLTFVGTAGLQFGSCYGMEIGWTQAAAVQNTWYDISDADMVTGQLHGVTHDGNGQLTAVVAGMYLADWSGAFEADAANVHVLVTFSVNGTEINAGMNHFETVAVNREASCAGNAILDLAANDTVNISIRTTDAGAPDLSVDHLMLRLVQIGGT